MTRSVLLILVLAAPASAEPFIRWVDKTGGVQRASVAKVLEESVAAIKVRLVDGTDLAMPTAPLLHLVRERSTDPDERALLRARRAAWAGEDVERTRRVLDRMAADGREDWMREYGVVARAILAQRTGEEGAMERVQKALKAHPRSRFVPDLIRARACLVSLAGKDLQEQQGPFVKAYRAIASVDGALLARFGTFIDAGRRMAQTEEVDWTVFLSATGQALRDAKAEHEGDVVVHIIAESSYYWMLLAKAKHQRKQQIALGVKPHGALAQVRKLKGYTSLLLPELRADVYCELGVILAACGDREGARAEYEAALESATDLWRRRAAREGLKALETLETKEKKK